MSWGVCVCMTIIPRIDDKQSRNPNNLYYKIFIVKTKVFRRKKKGKIKIPLFCFPMKISRALISVSNKTGIADFAFFLHQQGIELISTGGTAKLLREKDFPYKMLLMSRVFPKCWMVG